MSPRTMVITDFGPEVEITAFLCTRKEKLPKMAKMLSDHRNFPLLYKIGAAECSAIVRIVGRSSIIAVSMHA